jgi:hypothetical protein
MALPHEPGAAAMRAALRGEACIRDGRALLCDEPLEATRQPDLVLEAQFLRQWDMLVAMRPPLC